MKLWHVARVEIWPRARRPLAVELGLRFCAVFMFINAMSVLHLGIRGTPAEWVHLMLINITLITYGDVTPLIPLAALIVVPLSVHLLVDPFRLPVNGLYDSVNLEIAFSAEPPIPGKVER